MAVAIEYVIINQYKAIAACLCLSFNRCFVPLHIEIACKRIGHFVASVPLGSSRIKAQRWTRDKQRGGGQWVADRVRCTPLTMPSFRCLIDTLETGSRAHLGPSWNMICCNGLFFSLCQATWQSITMNRKSANKIKCSANFSDFLLVPSLRSFRRHTYFRLVCPSHFASVQLLRVDVLRDIKPYLNRYFDSASHTSSPWLHMPMISLPFHLVLSVSLFPFFAAHSLAAFLRPSSFPFSPHSAHTCIHIDTSHFPSTCNTSFGFCDYMCLAAVSADPHLHCGFWANPSMSKIMVNYLCAGA